MNVLVNGLGNIGQTVLAVLIEHKELLGVDQIYALKNIPKPFEDYSDWSTRGVQLFFEKDRLPIETIHYVFDCTASGISVENKVWYETFQNLKGASAQGTEHIFGHSYMLGVNEYSNRLDKYHHIVSCNTHGIISVLKHFSDDLNQVKEADFVVIRRSEDIGNHQRLVSANVVARHRTDTYGTHHAEDATKLLSQVNISIPLFSSDITTPSQLMHSVRFNISLKSRSSFKQSLYSTITKTFDSNIVFEKGRRDGFQGRLYHQSIIVENNLVKTENSIKGWAFIPQEGNTILSTMASYLSKRYEKEEFYSIIQKLYNLL